MRGSKRLGWLVLLLALLWLGPRGSVQPAAAQAGFLLRYSGAVESQGDPSVPTGTVVTIITARTPTNTTICGYGAIVAGGGSLGTYRAEIPSSVGPACDYRTWGTPGVGLLGAGCDTAHQYRFIVNGATVQTDCPLVSLVLQGGDPTLSRLPPGGQTIDDLDLTIADTNPGLGAQSAPGSVILPIEHVFGQILLRNTSFAEPVPAPRGTCLLAYCDDCSPVSGTSLAQVGYQAAQQATGKPICGSASVYDDNGRFSLDYQPIPACATRPGCAALGLRQDRSAGDTCGTFHAGVLLADIVTTVEIDPDNQYLPGFCFLVGPSFWGEADGPVRYIFEPARDFQPGANSPLKQSLRDPANLLAFGGYVPPEQAAPQLACTIQASPDAIVWLQAAANPIRITSATVSRDGSRVVVEGRVDDSFSQLLQLQIEVSQACVGGTSSLWESPPFGGHVQRIFRLEIPISTPGSGVFKPGPATLNEEVTVVHPYGHVDEPQHYAVSVTLKSQ